MEKFTAAQARAMMPNRNATKLVEYILSGVSARAKSGQYDITIGCPDDIYTECDIEAAEKQLKKLGYNVNHGYGVDSIWFLWIGASLKNFPKILSADAVRAE